MCLNDDYQFADCVVWCVVHSEPASLNQLVSLFVQRSHSVWKVPEVVIIVSADRMCDPAV